MRWLGNMSYSYCLLHGLALNAVFLLLSNLMPISVSVAMVPAVMALSFAITLLASAVLFLLVERPFSLSRAAAVRMH